MARKINARCPFNDECRRSFAEGLRYKKTSDAVNLLDGAIMAMFCQMFRYANIDKQKVCERIDPEWEYDYTVESDNRLKKAVFETNIDTLTPFIIYLAFEDSEGEGYASSYKQEYPSWHENERLDMLYKWLTLMGYEMSDEEIAMQNGTHALFKEQKSGT